MFGEFIQKKEAEIKFKTDGLRGTLQGILLDDDKFRFNNASTHKGHLRQNGVLTWFCNETAIMISHSILLEAEMLCTTHYWTGIHHIARAREWNSIRWTGTGTGTGTG